MCKFIQVEVYGTSWRCFAGKSRLVEPRRGRPRNDEDIFGRFSDFKWLKINLDAILELQKVENEEKVCYVTLGSHANTLRGL